MDGDGEIDLKEVMQAKVEYKMKEREMHNASKNWNSISRTPILDVFE